MSKETSRLFARVAEDLAQKIGSGRFAIGDRLPSERVLAQEYNVSRPTVREALFALELDGLVEARVGSGVYVTSRLSPDHQALPPEMGPFEILEARRAIEGEACALAARRITPEQLDELHALLDVINLEKTGDLARSEAADREFHELIARATQNSAMFNAVETLWDARDRSREYVLMSKKAHAGGVFPQLDDHRAIYVALASGDPSAARKAMHRHLTHVLDSILHATEIHEVEQAKERVEAKRRKFSTLA